MGIVIGEMGIVIGEMGIVIGEMGIVIGEMGIVIGEMGIVIGEMGIVIGETSHQSLFTFNNDFEHPHPKQVFRGWCARNSLLAIVLIVP